MEYRMTWQWKYNLRSLQVHILHLTFNPLFPSLLHPLPTSHTQLVSATHHTEYFLKIKGKKGPKRCEQSVSERPETETTTECNHLLPTASFLFSLLFIFVRQEKDVGCHLCPPFLPLSFIYFFSCPALHLHCVRTQCVHHRWERSRLVRYHYHSRHSGSIWFHGISPTSPLTLSLLSHSYVTLMSRTLTPLTLFSSSPLSPLLTFFLYPLSQRWILIRHSLSPFIHLFISIPLRPRLFLLFWFLVTRCGVVEICVHFFLFSKKQINWLIKAEVLYI